MNYIQRKFKKFVRDIDRNFIYSFESAFLIQKSHF